MIDEKEAQRQTILYFWNNGVYSAKELHALTNMPIPTIYYNIEKLKKTGEVWHKGGNGRPKKITGGTARAIGQYVRRDTPLSLRTLTSKVYENDVNVSHMTISRYLKECGYQKSIPKQPYVDAKQRITR